MLKSLLHQSAKASHYNKSAQHYDVFNEANSKTINQLIAKILTENKVKDVLDLTCGNGSQVFYLSQLGFHMTGVDINSKMLNVAKAKAKQTKQKLTFVKGDLSATRLGQFDAVLTIFNAIGHLTKVDFEQALDNIYQNLKPGGLYLFDINNLKYCCLK